MKTNQQICEEFRKEFNPSGLTFPEVDRDKLISFILAQRSQDIEEIKRWAENEKIKIKESDFGNDDYNRGRQAGYLYCFDDLLSFLNSLNK